MNNVYNTVNVVNTDTVPTTDLVNKIWLDYKVFRKGSWSYCYVYMGVLYFQSANDAGGSIPIIDLTKTRIFGTILDNNITPDTSLAFPYIYIKYFANLTPTNESFVVREWDNSGAGDIDLRQSTPFVENRTSSTTNIKDSLVLKFEYPVHDCLKYYQSIGVKADCVNFYYKAS